MPRSCAYMCMYSAQIKCFEFHGIFKREKYVDDIMTGIQNCKVSGIKHLGQEATMSQQLTISQRLQLRSIYKSNQKNQGKKIVREPLFRGCP